MPRWKEKLQEISGVTIRLASPDTIRNWSFGEVTKPETINYRSFKPERDGLFCEKIFGPVRNWECNCGKYKRIRYRGVVCDRCGVEVTHSKVRRERMGHIELAVPIVHIWFLKTVPSHISYLLGLPNTVLERIVYYESYVMIDPGNTNLRKGMLLSEDEYIELEEQGKQFVAKMGGEAALEILATLDLEELSIDLRSKIKLESSEQRRLDHLKRLRIAEAFLRSGNKPEHMVLRVLPVLPPGPAAARAARRRTVRDLGPERPLPPRHQPQQPAQETHRNQGARRDPAQRNAHAAGIGRHAVRQRPAHLLGQGRRQTAA